jgi:VanZ family protein
MNLQTIFYTTRRWLPAIIMMATIFAFSSIPSNHLPNFNIFDEVFKKGGHIIGYALLAAAYLFGIGKKDSSSLIIASLMCILYALSDEYHQSFIPGRHPSPIDIMIDSIGITIGLLIIHRYNFK